MSIFSSLSASTTGAIHKNGTSVQTADFATASTTWTDVTNPATLTLTTTKVCTIIAFCQGTFRNSSGGAATHLRLMIDGTAGQPVRIADAADVTYPMYAIARKATVAAGSVTIKMQMVVTAGTATLDHDATANTELVASIIAFAIEE